MTVDAHGNIHSGQTGQFTGHLQAEGDTDQLLGAPSDAAYEMAQVPIRIDYSALELPSPRHRKYVNVAHHFDLVGEVRCVSAEQAPVVFDVEGAFQPQQLREFDGDLYELAGREPEQFDPETLGARLSGWGCFATEEENAVEPQAKLDDMLVIDGQLWRRAGEPMYVVQTFGLGNNHGGTGIGIDLHYNSNIDAACYFRADEFELARAFAIETAEGRGDTRSAEHLRSMEPTITVHNPAAVTAVMPLRESREVRDARGEYRRHLDEFTHRMGHQARYGRAALEEAHAAMNAAHARLTALTDDLGGFAAAEPPHEGRTGTWRTRAQNDA